MKRFSHLAFSQGGGGFWANLTHFCGYFINNSISLSPHVLKQVSISKPKQNFKFSNFERNFLPIDGKFTSFSNLNQKCAFTLAEVLITLGIVGVVAAMTLPALTTKYQKTVTENKLKKFYSVMSQAIRLSEAEYGEYPNWAPGEDVYNNSDKFEEWYNKYLDKQIESQYKTKLNSQYYQVSLKDGSGFAAYVSGNDVNIMYCTEMKHCGIEKYDGKVSFLFLLRKTAKTRGYFITDGEGSPRQILLERCKYGNVDNPEVSSMGRRHKCAALIQLDGWRIKNDYPWDQVKIEDEK